MVNEELMTRFLRLRPDQRQEFLRVAPAGTRPPIPVRPRAGWPAEFPVTPGQQSLYFLWRLAPDSATYHVPMAYDIAGPLRIGPLTAAVGAVVTRHEALRTTFAERGSELLQQVHRELPADVAIGEVPDRERAMQCAEAAAHEPFDLRRGPLVRLRVWRYGPERHLVLLALHHIVVDERSSRIVEQELAACYRAETGGEPARLPVLDRQYGDYADWLSWSSWPEQRRYWLQQLAGATATRMPGHRQRPSISLTGTTRQVRLPAAARERIGTLAGRCGVSRFVAAAAVFAMFLARRTGCTDLCFGTPVSGRTHPALTGLVGYFLNSVTLRIRIDPATTFDRLVADLRDVATDAVRRQDMPFHEVVQETRSVRADPGGPPFAVMFVHLTGDQTPHGTSFGPELAVTPTAVVPQGAPFDLKVGVVEEPDGVTLAFRYATELYEQAEVDSWIADLRMLLDRLPDQPDTPLRTLLAPVASG